MRDVGLEVRRDAFGNLYGRLEGTDPSLPAVRTGSHVDTTLNAGRYDGVVGVLGAIEAVAVPARSRSAARDRGRRVRGRGAAVRHAAASAAARSWATLSRDDLDRLVDRDGVSLAAALRGRGLRSRTPSTPPCGTRPRCTRSSSCTSSRASCSSRPATQVGVVTAIAAPHDLRITLQGAATHAGATPMALRRDALAGAAEAMVELERLAVGSPSGTTVGTVGVLRLRPGAINVVPGEVELDVDVRDSDGEARQAVVDGLLAVVGVLAATPRADRDRRRDRPRRAGQRARRSSSRPPRRRARRSASRDRHMISGAYHDALILVAEDARRDAVRAERGRREPPPRRAHRPRGHRPRRRRARRGPARSWRA